MKNQTFKAIAIFLAIFATAWAVKLMTAGPKEVTIGVYDGEGSIKESDLNKSEEINAEFRKADEIIASSSDTLVRNPKAKAAWDAYDQK